MFGDLDWPLNASLVFNENVCRYLNYFSLLQHYFRVDELVHYCVYIDQRYWQLGELGSTVHPSAVRNAPATSKQRSQSSARPRTVLRRYDLRGRS